MAEQSVILTWLSLIELQLRSELRALVPKTWVRRTLLSFLALLSLAGSVAMLLVPLSPNRDAPSVGALSGLVVANLALSVSLALAGAATLLRQPERLRALRLAPVPPSWIPLLPIVSILLLALLPLAVFFAPLVIGVFRLAPGPALLMVGLGAAIALWSVQLALWLVLQLARRLGRERGSRIAYLFAAALAFAALASFGFLIRWSTRPLPIVLFGVATLAVLPPWTAATARAFAHVLTSAEAPKYGRAPRWGRPSWWRTLARTPAVWALSGTLPVVVLLGLTDFPFRWGMIAVVLVSLSMVPLGHLFAAEYECLERWRLAPFNGRVRRSIFTSVALPFALGMIAAAVAVGWGAWTWVGGVAILTLLSPLTYMVFATLPRKLTQGLLTLAALATELVH